MNKWTRVSKDDRDRHLLYAENQRISTRFSVDSSSFLVYLKPLAEYSSMIGTAEMGFSFRKSLLLPLSIVLLQASLRSFFHTYDTLFNGFVQFESYYTLLCVYVCIMEFDEKNTHHLLIFNISSDACRPMIYNSHIFGRLNY